MATIALHKQPADRPNVWKLVRVYHRPGRHFVLSVGLVSCDFEFEQLYRFCVYIYSRGRRRVNRGWHSLFWFI